MANVVILDQTVDALSQRSSEKVWPFMSWLSSHSRSLELTRIDQLPMISWSYWRCLVTMGLSRTISEMKG